MANQPLTGRERMQAIFAGGADRCGFWHGNPHDDTTRIYWPYFGVKDDLELGFKFDLGGEGSIKAEVTGAHLGVYVSLEPGGLDRADPRRARVRRLRLGRRRGRSH